VYRLQGSGRIDQQHIHLAAAERALQAGAEPKLQLQAAWQEVRALHQHIHVTTALGVVGAGAKQQHARFVAHQFMGSLADDGLVLWRKTHGRQSIGRRPREENA